jgi:hypothetical protein
MTISHEPIEFGKKPTSKSVAQFEPFVIGEVDWSIEGDQLTLTVNGTDFAVAEDGFKYIVQYGLQQALTDSYATETTLDKASKKFTERLKKIVDGTMSLDGNRTADPLASASREVAVAIMCKLAGKSESALRKEFGKAWSKSVRAVLTDERYREIIAKRAQTIVDMKTFEIAAPVDETESKPEAQPEVAQPEGEKPTEPVAQPKVAAKRGRKAA